MSAEAIAYTDVEERTNKRVPFRGAVEYTTGCGETGHGEWVNVSHNGAALLMGRYLKPGRRIRISTYASEYTAEVAWCQPSSDRKHFEVGVQMVNEPVEASLTVLAAVASRLFCRTNKVQR